MFFFQLKETKRLRILLPGGHCFENRPPYQVHIARWPPSAGCHGTSQDNTPDQCLTCQQSLRRLQSEQPQWINELESNGINKDISYIHKYCHMYIRIEKSNWLKHFNYILGTSITSDVIPVWVVCTSQCPRPVPRDPHVQKPMMIEDLVEATCPETSIVSEDSW